MVKSFARPNEGTRVLDVGCGRALFLRELRRSTRATAVGIDQTDRPWREDPESLGGIELVAGPVPEALPPGPFAMVTLWQVLEHFDRPVEVLRALRRRAGPGATLVAEVPDHSAWTRPLQGRFWAGYDAPRHVSVFEPHTLRSTVERAGWTPLRLLRRGAFDPWILWWLGQEARAGRDLRSSLQSRLPAFLAGKLLTWPLVAATRGRGLGIQTIIARAIE
jgi:SAM-dependent methyltransferase